MRESLRTVGRILTFPIRAVWWLIKLPVRFFTSARTFLMTEPEEHPSGMFLQIWLRASKRVGFSGIRSRHSGATCSEHLWAWWSALRSHSHLLSD